MEWVIHVYYAAMLVGLLWIAYMIPKWIDELVEERVEKKVKEIFQKKKGVEAMKDLYKCPIMWKLLKEAIPCSYPDTDKCGRIGGSFLCKYRIAEIGKKNCLREVSELQDFAKHK